MTKHKTVLVAVLLAAAWKCVAQADNSIVVESRNFHLGQTACSVGVFLANDVEITALVLELELRSDIGDAFYLQPPTFLQFFHEQAGRRLDASPLGSADPQGRWPAASITRHRYDVPSGTPCSGPVSHTWTVNALNVGGTPPDAIEYVTSSQGFPGTDDIYWLSPGTDPPRTDSASWVFVFDANMMSGCFEIDTCCVRPSNHTVYIDRNTQIVPVAFTLGTICLDADPNQNRPPQVVGPPVIWQSAEPGQNGAHVNFTVAVGDEDSTLQAVSTPPSGSFFPMGTTLVTSIATDTAGLADTCWFDVVVHNATANSVRVESKSFLPGQVACSVGVFLENTEPVAGMVLIFEIRTVSGGAFYKGPVGVSFFRPQPGQRLDSSPLGSADSLGRWPEASRMVRRFDNPTFMQRCSGPIGNSWEQAAVSVGGTSPDAVEHATVSTGDPLLGQPISLAPGADLPFTANASLVFAFDADTLEGCFEIDTACTTPANHLNFIDESVNLIAPAFTKGTVCIRNCACNCHGNSAVCSDPSVNVLDVLYTVNVAFRGSPELEDPNPLCGRTCTDVDCDGVTSVIDVIKTVDVAFRNGAPSSVFCNPCP